MKRFISGWIIFSFVVSSIMAPQQGYAYEQLNLPVPGTMINLSPAYVPVLVKGLKVHPDNPLLFDFILDTGNSGLKVNSPEFKAESNKLIKYFLASLTIKEDDLWVNLSPYEKDRMIPDKLGKTELGRDMLAQDYILKQLTASLIYPEKQLGKEFWDRIYTKAQQMYGTAQIPVNTFNKVWIVADKAKVLERDNAAYVVGAHLKVMLEEDYMALQKHSSTAGSDHSVASQVIREIVLPELEKEVNRGQNFVPLRQMFYSMIMATWYKQALKSALLNQVYSNKGKTGGVLSDDPAAKEKIYERYLKAYKKGVFNYIKEDMDAVTKQSLPRKYFSGGLRMDVGHAMITEKEVQPGDNVNGTGKLALVTMLAASTFLGSTMPARAQNEPAPTIPNPIVTPGYEVVTTKSYTTVTTRTGSEKPSINTLSWKTLSDLNTANGKSTVYNPFTDPLGWESSLNGMGSNLVVIQGLSSGNTNLQAAINAVNELTQNTAVSISATNQTQPSYQFNWFTNAGFFSAKWTSPQQNSSTNYVLDLKNSRINLTTVTNKPKGTITTHKTITPEEPGWGIDLFFVSSFLEQATALSSGNTNQVSTLSTFEELVAKFQNQAPFNLPVISAPAASTSTVTGYYFTESDKYVLTMQTWFPNLKIELNLQNGVVNGDVAPGTDKWQEDLNDLEAMAGRSGASAGFYNQINAELNRTPIDILPWKNADGNFGLGYKFFYSNYNVADPLSGNLVVEDLSPPAYPGTAGLTQVYTFDLKAGTIQVDRLPHSAGSNATYQIGSEEGTLAVQNMINDLLSIESIYINAPRMEPAIDFLLNNGLNVPSVLIPADPQAGTPAYNIYERNWNDNTLNVVAFSSSGFTKYALDMQNGNFSDTQENGSIDQGFSYGSGTYQWENKLTNTIDPILQTAETLSPDNVNLLQDYVSQVGALSTSLAPVNLTIPAGPNNIGLVLTLGAGGVTVQEAGVGTYSFDFDNFVTVNTPQGTPNITDPEYITALAEMAKDLEIAVPESPANDALLEQDIASLNNAMGQSGAQQDPDYSMTINLMSRRQALPLMGVLLTGLFKVNEAHGDLTGPATVTNTVPAEAAKIKDARTQYNALLQDSKALESSTNQMDLLDEGIAGRLKNNLSGMKSLVPGLALSEKENANVTNTLSNMQKRIDARAAAVKEFKRQIILAQHTVNVTMPYFDIVKEKPTDLDILKALCLKVENSLNAIEKGISHMPATMVIRYIERDGSKVIMNKKDLESYVKDTRGKLKDFEKAKNIQFKAADKNQAMMTRDVGGIDLNSRNMGLDIIKEGKGVEMKFDPAMVAQFQRGNFSGIAPNIIRIIPIASPLPLLGINSAKEPVALAKA